MKLIKKTLIMVSAAVLMFILLPSNANAAEKITAKQLVKCINNQLESAKNITAAAYLGNISKNNYISTVAVNSKDKILYADWYALGIDKFYIYKNKMYTYSPSEKKWKSEKITGRKYTCNYKIHSEASVKLLGSKKFNGKACYALQVKRYSISSIYYVEKSDKNLIGIVTASKNKKVYMKIDTKTAIKVPSYVIKGSKVNSDTIANEAIKVNALPIEGVEADDVRITSYNQLQKLIKQIKASKEYKANKSSMSRIMSRLESYDKSYFKSKSLYLKNYTNCSPESVFAISKSSSSGKMSIVLTGYYNPDVVYPEVTRGYLVFIEAGSKAASTIKNVKISYDKNNYILPNIH